ncbi:hypothetical protein C3747_68g161 [Trypanosoma cruzi]|uniref:AB hydrolase-1 domain-containing protein n=2 Tax=Trypanosoma cruzi TaxID=5693 RepID=Q4DWM7_TRYCC|nr:hypothetical protein, conserved [Trypanosoma cruzi]APG54974.1 amastigote surface antigen [Trypanosoma cruzi]APG54975.1 amastigote surface antigen [Trypanosoma cruzi]EAN96932.1 hypothetical protein, conserved [Trypanosoma cruzi]KAF5222901.1 hypothetical protein ECC02_003987 [Trypanosoma cruzi]KAF8301716.1 hypothetical protein TcYC6_0050010 [Trypanosoma cruzi]|eukprot:XP_818783.1 hypothetical protein [Trypanosoma cruzi strain CL Brener]
MALKSMRKFTPFFVSVLLHIFILLACFSSLAALAADPPTPVWSRYGCNAGFNFCANVTTKESWSEDGNNIYLFLDALVYEDDIEKANTTVWYVGENFDDSWASDLRREAFDVVRFSFRGSEFAQPQITCRPDQYTKNHCMPSVECAEEIRRSGLNMMHYSTEETAKDLIWVIKQLGKGKLNVIVAEGLGSVVVQRALGMEDQLKNVSVVMAGFTHPQYFDIFKSINGYDAVLQRVLALCEGDKTLLCVSRVGALEGLWNRFVNVMRAAEANTLKCNKLLNWGADAKEMYTEYRSIVAALLKKPQNPLMLSDWKLLQLIPSFIYRLQRCEARDQQALTQLREFVRSTERNRCPLFVAQRYNWLLNEMILTRPPAPPKELMEAASMERLVMPSILLLQQLYDTYKAFPKYNATKISVARTRVPLLLLPSDIDPLFSLGMAAQASIIYGATIRRLPHQSNLPVANSASNCIKANLMHYRRHFEWADAAQCNLDNIYRLNFTAFDAYDFYGVTDAWEFTTPNMAEPPVNNSATNSTSPPCEGANEGSSRAMGFITVLFVLTLLGLFGMTYLYWTKARSLKFSDDFYSNLNH